MLVQREAFKDWSLRWAVTAAAAAVLFGPVLAHADVIERRIASGNDDAEEDLGGGGMDLGSSDLELNNEGGTPQSVGMRFTNIDIPPGSIIQSAFIQFTVDEMDSGPTSLTVSGELSPDAAAFGSNTGNITNRPLTAAFVEWNDLPPWNTVGEAGPDQQTPDIASVVQEIVNQPQWTTGNALVLVIDGNPGGERTAESFNGVPGSAPLLTITFARPVGFDRTSIVAATVDAPLSVGLTIAEGCNVGQNVTYAINSSDAGVTAAAAPGTLTFADGAEPVLSFDLEFNGPGTATLSASADAGSPAACTDIAGLTVEVIGLQSGSLILRLEDMATSRTQQADVSGRFGAAGTRDISAASAGTTYTVTIVEDPNGAGVVTVSPDGELLAIGVGVVDVTATNGSSSDTERITVVALIFAEDFEGLPLGDSVDEGISQGITGTNVWTKTPPDGWLGDDTGIPGVGDPAMDGCTEWAGWSFTDREWWTATAGDQNRSQFVLGTGTVMVADPDEWDDCTPHADLAANNWYATDIMTPPMSLAGIKENTAILKFDSSWRDEFDSSYRQSVRITVSFDGGAPIEILLWLSDPNSPDFKDDAENETIRLNLNNPPGAKSMVLTFSMFDAGNDWWWAIDNILITGVGVPAPAAFIPDPVFAAEVDDTLSVGLAIAPICSAGSGVTFSVSSSDLAVAMPTGTATFALGQLTQTLELEIGGVGTATLSTTNDAGCLDGTTTIEVLPIETASVALALPSMEVGDRQQVRVTGSYGPAGTRDITDSATGTTYVSSDPSVATVDANGAIVAVGNGSTEITASHGAASGSATLVVSDQLTKIAFIAGSLNLNESDQAVVAHLNGLLFSEITGQLDPGGLPPKVTVFDDNDFDENEIEANFTILIGSSTMSSGNVGAKFTCKNIPFIYWEQALNRTGREGLASNGGSA